MKQQRGVSLTEGAESLKETSVSWAILDTWTDYTQQPFDAQCKNILVK